MPVLRVNNLSAFYDRTQVLHEINLRVEGREIVGLVGANGAGKTTTLLSIIGIKARTEGEIWLNEERIDRLPAYERVRRAIVLIPERRRLFPFMTVLENLELGAYLPGPRRDRNASLETVFDLLPVLAEAPLPDSGFAQRRRAADVRHRPCTDESPATPHAR